MNHRLNYLYAEILKLQQSIIDQKTAFQQQLRDLKTDYNSKLGHYSNQIVEIIETISNVSSHTEVETMRFDLEELKTHVSSVMHDLVDLQTAHDHNVTAIMNEINSVDSRVGRIPSQSGWYHSSKGSQYFWKS